MIFLIFEIMWRKIIIQVLKTCFHAFFGPFQPKTKMKRRTFLLAA